MNEVNDKLLHPSLLQNFELIMLIRERQLTTCVLNIDELNRDELMEIFKKHIMPKPQRKQRNNTGSSNETVSLSKEVKRIKLSNNQQPQPMDCISHSSSTLHCKRTTQEPSENFNKRRRVQWP